MPAVIYSYYIVATLLYIVVRDAYILIIYVKNI
jgi:hypothetical protein